MNLAVGTGTAKPRTYPSGAQRQTIRHADAKALGASASHTSEPRSVLTANRNKAAGTAGGAHPGLGCAGPSGPPAHKRSDAGSGRSDRLEQSMHALLDQGLGSTTRTAQREARARTWRPWRAGGHSAAVQRRQIGATLATVSTGLGGLLTWRQWSIDRREQGTPRHEVGGDRTVTAGLSRLVKELSPRRAAGARRPACAGNGARSRAKARSLLVMKLASGSASTLATVNPPHRAAWQARAYGPLPAPRLLAPTENCPLGGVQLRC